MAGRLRAITAGLIIAALALGLRLYRFEFPHTSALDALQAGTLPPGLHWDEAFNTLAALRLVRGGGLEPFIRIDLGRLPLHIYLTALMFALFGPLTVGGRLAAMLLGLLNLVILPPLIRAAFADALSAFEQRKLAWFMAAQIAVTFWFVFFSRIGLEQSTLPFFSALSMWALWWAAKHPARWRAVMAGGLLALALYTYTAAYALPIVALGIGLHYVLTQRAPRAINVTFLLAYSAGFAIVSLPLGSFAVFHPEWVFEHPAATRAASLTAVGQNILGVMSGLVWRGDSNTSYNLPLRPFFDGGQAVLFLIGLGVSLRRVRQPAYAFGLIWLGVMLLPQIFSEAPHFGRIVGATVPAVLITAIGGLTLWRALARWSTRLATLCLAGITLASAGLTARDYFVRWPQTPDLYPTFRVAERVEAELARQLPADALQYLSPVDGAVPTIRYLLDDRPDDYLKFFNGRACSVWPPSERGARYLITAYEDTRTTERLAQAYGPSLSVQSYSSQTFRLVDQITIPAGSEPELPEGNLPTPDQRVGGLLQPVAVVLPSSTISVAMSTLPVTLVWQVVGQTTEDFTLGVYLLGPDFPAPDSGIASQVDRQPCEASYPTSRWTAGEWIVEERQLPLPASLQPGRYTLGLALYRWPSLERLPVTRLDGTPLGDVATLAQVVMETRP